MNTILIVGFLTMAVFVLMVRTPKNRQDAYHDTVVEFRGGGLIEVSK